MSNRCLRQQLAECIPAHIRLCTTMSRCHCQICFRRVLHCISTPLIIRLVHWLSRIEKNLLLMHLRVRLGFDMFRLLGGDWVRATQVLPVPHVRHNLQISGKMINHGSNRAEICPPIPLCALWEAGREELVSSKPNMMVSYRYV